MRNYFFTLLLSFSSLFCAAQLQRFSFTQPKMGSPFTIIFYTRDSMHAQVTAQNCFKLADSLINILSDYIDSSELNRLCARAGNSGNSFICSPTLYDILLQSKFAYEKSLGSFDITLGPVTRLWRKARKEKIFPQQDSVKEKLALTGFTKIQIDTVTHAAYLLQAGMQLDLGGIGQGYIAQQVMNYLKTQQIENTLIDVSGDIVCSGTPPGTKGWTVAINVPESDNELLPRHLLIANKSVTTSGDVYQFMEHDGKRYSHIVDPATGYGITSQKNVTVIADDGTTADWFTKACSILPLTKAKKIAADLHAEFLIAEVKKGKLVYYKSKGFDKYWKGIIKN
ncbi:MAG: FAD:protein FMN transferase [Bacteroidota bacterium]